MPYLNKVDFLDLRDDCLFLKKWGIKYQVTVDDIFAYMLVYHNKKVVLLSDVLQTLLEKKFTTVCLQSWAMDAQSQELYSYARKNIADFLNELLINDRQMHVYFLEFMHLDHDRERNEEVYRMLSDEAKSRCVFLSCSNFHPFDIALLAGKAQFCITTRLHLSIFSMMAKVPTYSIVLDNYYKMKLEGICAYFSSACTHDLRTCSTEDILKNYRSTQMVQLSSNVQELVRRKYIGVACVYLKATPKTSLVKRVRLHLLIHKLRRLSP